MIDVVTQTIAYDVDIDSLLFAYGEVVMPEVERGRVLRGNCLAMSAAGAEVLRRLGSDAQASAVEVTFVDHERSTWVVTKSSRFALPERDVAPGVDPDHLDNAHAVILTPTHLLDLTFGQFDQRGICPPILLVGLPDGWCGQFSYTAPDETWSVLLEDKVSDVELRRYEAALASNEPGLVELLAEAALSYRSCRLASTKRLGRNDRCPCGSGRKVKHCVH